MIPTLKFFQCTKQVHAEPMPYGEFKLSIRKVRDMGQIDPMEPGYHVVYGKGMTNEYHSWSPKQAFDEGYLEIPAGTSKPISSPGGKVN